MNQPDVLTKYSINQTSDTAANIDTIDIIDKYIDQIENYIKTK
jgi:hypothetical protein